MTDNKIAQPVTPAPEVEPQEIIKSEAIPTPPEKKSKKLLFIVLPAMLFIVAAIGGFSTYQKYRQGKFQAKTAPILPEEIITKEPQPGQIYTDPCETGDKKGCIMKNAYSRLKKSSELENYTIVWDEAFKICEENPDDQSILFTVAQCKLDVCNNLHLGDGNIKYNYPEAEKCRKKVLPICRDGSIIENIPCACDVPAGPYTAYTQDWLENYWNKYRKNDPPIYCCSGKQQDSPCSPDTQ